MNVGVVGAGPAGSLLAWRLARDGAAVTVYDASHPREKPCGGGLTAKALTLLPDAPPDDPLPARLVHACRFESGQGELTGRTALGFSQTLDTRVPRRSMFWPSEEAQLRELCTDPGVEDDKAFSYDTLPTGSYHDIACDRTFGAAGCSCGATIAGRPIYGVAP